MAYGRFPEQLATASDGWTGDDTFAAKICFSGTPFLVTLGLKLSGDRILFDSDSNAALGPTKPPQLVGRSE